MKESNNLKLILTYFSGDESDNELQNIIKEAHYNNINVGLHDLSGKSLNFGGPDIYITLQNIIIDGIIFEAFKCLVLKIWHLFRGKKLKYVSSGGVKEIEASFGIHCIKKEVKKTFTAKFPLKDKVVINEDKMLNSLFEKLNNSPDDNDVNCVFLEYETISEEWVEIDIHKSIYKESKE